MQGSGTDACACMCAGKALDFSKGRWLDLDRGIITATPAVHTALLKAIETVGTS